jgi:hypothetical protein
MLVLSKETLLLSPLMIPASPGLQLPSGLLATADHVKSGEGNSLVSRFKGRGASLTDDVEGDNGTLKQSRARLSLLDSRCDRQNADSDADDHVERDEELVEGAVVGLSVEVEEQDDADEREDVLDEGGRHQSPEPALRLGFFVVSDPDVSPVVRKVNDEDELDENEGETAKHSDPHHPRSEIAILDEERADGNGNDDEEFESPEAVLDGSSSIARGSNANHHRSHGQEEHQQSEANAINGQVSNCVCAVDGRRRGNHH